LRERVATHIGTKQTKGAPLQGVRFSIVACTGNNFYPRSVKPECKISLHHCKDFLHFFTMAVMGIIFVINILRVLARLWHEWGILQYKPPNNFVYDKDF
jgi:hypothetical protein